MISRGLFQPWPFCDFLLLLQNRNLQSPCHFPVFGDSHSTAAHELPSDCHSQFLHWPPPSNIFTTPCLYSHQFPVSSSLILTPISSSPTPCIPISCQISPRCFFLPTKVANTSLLFQTISISFKNFLSLTGCLPYPLYLFSVIPSSYSPEYEPLAPNLTWTGVSPLLSLMLHVQPASVLPFPRHIPQPLLWDASRMSFPSDLGIVPLCTRADWFLLPA